MIYDLLHSVIDPETGINIVDMGLIYGVNCIGDGVNITMTMTSAACPMSDLLIEDIEGTLRERLPESTKMTVALIFDPPWNPSMMSESARSQFGW